MYCPPTQQWYGGSIKLLSEENNRSRSKTFTSDPVDWSSGDEEPLIKLFYSKASADHYSNGNEDSSNNEPLINLIKPEVPTVIPNCDLDEQYQNIEAEETSTLQPIFNGC
nr:unnamed protein product [Callosobruchus chinensis]